MKWTGIYDRDPAVTVSKPTPKELLRRVWRVLDDNLKGSLLVGDMELWGTDCWDGLPKADKGVLDNLMEKIREEFGDKATIEYDKETGRYEVRIEDDDGGWVVLIWTQCSYLDDVEGATASLQEYNVEVTLEIPVKARSAEGAKRIARRILVRRLGTDL